MSVLVIVPPEEMPVTVAEVKIQLGITDTSKDVLLESLIEAATGQIDGPDGLLGRALITQTLEYQASAFSCGDVRLPCPIVQSIVSVKYDDSAGAEQTVTSGKYRLIAPNTLGLASGSIWPIAFEQTGSVRIRYVAGYGNAAAVPAPIKQAILLSVKNLYSIGLRDPYVVTDTVNGVGSKQFSFSDAGANVVQNAVDSLLAGYRVVF